MKNRFVAALLFLALLVVPHTSHAQSVSTGKAKFSFAPLYMRNTSAASVAREVDWTKGAPGAPAPGFVDSVTFSVGAATATDRDTTVAISTASLPMPPHSTTTAGGTTSLIDTTFASRMPWIAIRVRQDTTRYSFSGTSTMDSFYVAAQVSYDGVTWLNVNGTPTVTFETTNGAAGADGTVPVLAGPYGEISAGADAATATFDCLTNLITRVSNSGWIINRSLCMANAMVRFLVNMDGSGQYVVELGSWKDYD